MLCRTPIDNTVKFDHSHAAIQTYALFVQSQHVVQGQHDTRFIHSTNEDRRRVIVVYSEGKMAHEDYDLILHSRIREHTRTNQYKRTRCSSRSNTAPGPYMQPTQINARSLIINIIIVVYLESKQNGRYITCRLILVHQTPITASSKVNRTRSNNYKRTRCSCLSTTNMTPVPYIQRAEINAESTSPLYCIVWAAHA